jgi:hypothetical protein
MCCSSVPDSPGCNYKDIWESIQIGRDMDKHRNVLITVLNNGYRVRATYSNGRIKEITEKGEPCPDLSADWVFNEMEQMFDWLRGNLSLKPDAESNTITG